MSKRQNLHSTPVQQESADVAALSTIGMRIRKAVSEGYSVGSTHPNSYQRVPLPAGMTSPPALTNVGSTLDSSTSSLAEWDSKYDIVNAPVQTIPTYGQKRKHDESGAGEFQSKYGQLSFTDEF